MRSGNHTGDVSEAIQKYVEGHGFHVTRDYTGHGVGRKCTKVRRFQLWDGWHGHALTPWCGNRTGTMVLIGTHRTKVSKDKWTVVSADGSLTAHFEHTVAVTEEILSS